MKGDVDVKRAICFVSFAVIVCFITSQAVFAGDFGGYFCNSDDGKIYFATVSLYDAEAEVTELEVTPIKRLKGDISTGIKRTLENPKPIGTKIRAGNVYLVGEFVEGEEPYIFETTSYDTSSLKLKGITDKDIFWKEFEMLLNNGAVERAEQRRIDKLNAPLTVVGEQITLTELLRATEKKYDADKVTFSLSTLGEHVEVDKERFFEIADTTVLTDVEDVPLYEQEGENVRIKTEGLQIMVSFKTDKGISPAFITPDGLVDNYYGMYSSRLPKGDYTIKASDIARLKELLPEGAERLFPMNQKRKYIIWGICFAGIIIFIGMWGFALGYKTKKKHQK